MNNEISPTVRMQELTFEAQEWRRRAERAEAALAERDAEIARIRASYDRREGIVADRETTIANQQAEIERLHAELEEQSGKAHAACERMIAYSKERESLHAEAAAMRGALARLRRIGQASGWCADPEWSADFWSILKSSENASDAGKAMLERVERHERDRLYAIPALEEIARQFGKCKCHEEQCAGCIALELRDRFAALDGKEGV